MARVYIISFLLRDIVIASPSESQVRVLWVHLHSKFTAGLTVAFVSQERKTQWGKMANLGTCETRSTAVVSHFPGAHEKYSLEFLYSCGEWLPGWVALRFARIRIFMGGWGFVASQWKAEKNGQFILLRAFSKRGTDIGPEIWIFAAK